MARSHEDVLNALLESRNSYEFSILKLSEPIAGPPKKDSGERTSDVSADVFENPSPASLEADLAHYKVHQNKYIIIFLLMRVNRSCSLSYDSLTSNK